MNVENLTEDELKDLILKKQLEWIKLCQDNFIIFAVFWNGSLNSAT